VQAEVGDDLALLTVGSGQRKCGADLRMFGVDGFLVLGNS
jgi:hypothetical protein